MGDLLRVKRGLKNDLPELMQGEFGFCTDTFELFIGGVDGNVGINVDSINVKWFGAKGDGVTDDTIAFENALDYLESLQGGEVIVPAGTFILRYLKLRTRVSIVGKGKSTILKLKDGTNTDLITLKEGKVTQCVVKDLAIDGNKANNTSGNGIYLYKDSMGYTYAKMPNPIDSTMIFENVYIYECKGDGFRIDGIGTVGPDYINMRTLLLRNVESWRNDGNGFYARRLTDSIIDSCISHNNKIAGFNMDGASLKFVNCKSFYDASDLDNGKAGFYFTALRRSSIVNCEAQENYKEGFIFDWCYHLGISECMADANGRITAEFPDYAPAVGFLFTNSYLINGNLIANSFHTPSWQGKGLKISNCYEMNINLVVDNQVTSNYEMAGVNWGLTLNINGSLHANGSSPFNLKDTNTSTEIRSFDDGDGSDVCIQINPKPLDNTSNANIRIFRDTNTSGVKELQMYKGDGTSTLQHRLKSNGVELCQDNGNVQIGPNATGGAFNTPHILLGPWHIWVDTSGRLRMKNDWPAGPTDGTVIGTQS